MIPLRDTIPSQSLPLVTLTCIGLNVLVFLYELELGTRLERFFALYGFVLQGRSCFCLSGVLSPVMGFYNALSPACPNTLPERPTNPLLGGLDGGRYSIPCSIYSRENLT